MCISFITRLESIEKHSCALLSLSELIDENIREDEWKTTTASNKSYESNSRHIS